MNNGDPLGTLYGLLGISAESSYAEVKRAFRFASLASHPDRNKDDPFAEQRFKAIGAAWALVDTAEKWEAHQAAGQAPPPRGEGPAPSARPRRHSPPSAESKVVVYGYTQWFAINLERPRLLERRADRLREEGRLHLLRCRRGRRGLLQDLDSVGLRSGHSGDHDQHWDAVGPHFRQDGPAGS